MTLDAEDHTTAESRMAILHELRREFDWVGNCFAGLSQANGGGLPWNWRLGARIRLCKGAYDEPSSVAYRSPREVNESHLRCPEILMAATCYPMVASHDPGIISAAATLRVNWPSGRSIPEYQMLYGISDAGQRRLNAEGNHVRVYVPFLVLSGMGTSSADLPSGRQSDVLSACSRGAADATASRLPGRRPPALRPLPRQGPRRCRSARSLLSDPSDLRRVKAHDVAGLHCFCDASPRKQSQTQSYWVYHCDPFHV